MDRLGPPAERLQCSLCSWRSETDWAVCDARPPKADFEWAHHAKKDHPLIAGWIVRAFSGVRQN